MWIFALFLAVPLIEIGLFVTVGGWLTLWPTLAIVLMSGVLGVAVLRGRFAALGNLHRAPESAFAQLADNGVLGLAGILLILPGFLTDGLGFLLLIPQVRRLLLKLIGWRLGLGGGVKPQAGDQDTGRGDIIDADYVDVTKDHPNLETASKWSRH
jgi:UPF0716 protein FxsA